jgi:signal transduction histidine kinase
MITAYASLETAVTATKRGAFDFLAKPFTPEELKAAVRKAAASLLLSRQARRLSQEKRQVRFQFIRVLAHELQAPIAAIEGYLHILRDGTVADRKNAEHMLDRCLVRTGQMRKLVADLLDLTGIESGIKKREMVNLDLREVALAAVETIRPAADERRISVIVRADAPIQMTADRGELDIILSNLLSNAVKYNRDGGRVELAVAAEQGRATIRVSDTGIGMTQEEVGRLFKDFSRIRNEKTRHVFGSGLGLSTLRKVVELYGGAVNVESRPDIGSVFTVTLKTDASAAPPEASAAGE